MSDIIHTNASNNPDFPPAFGPYITDTGNNFSPFLSINILSLNSFIFSALISNIVFSLYDLKFLNENWYNIFSLL